MATPTKEEVTLRRGDGARAAGEAAEDVAEQVRPVAAGSVREAAEAAADKYGMDEMEKHAEAIAKAWEATLKQQIKANRQRVKKEQQRVKEEQQEAGEVITFHGPFGFYQWWNVLLAGPFQPLAAGGPFLPHKIIRHGEQAFMLAAIVRNPNPLPPGFPNPSAADIMAPFEYCVRLQTGNLTTWDPGPGFGPQCNVFGGGFFNVEVINLAGFPQPPDGQPDLYEGNLVMDILGPVAGLPPFAGYSTWVLDPDMELPFLFVPGQGPQLQHDIPARFLIYR